MYWIIECWILPEVDDIFDDDFAFYSFLSILWQISRHFLTQISVKVVLNNNKRNEGMRTTFKMKTIYFISLFIIFFTIYSLIKCCEEKDYEILVLKSRHFMDQLTKYYNNHNKNDIKSNNNFEYFECFNN